MWAFSTRLIANKNGYIRSYITSTEFGKLKLPLETIDSSSDIEISKCFDDTAVKQTIDFDYTKENEIEAKLELSSKPFFKKNSPNWYWLKVKELIKEGQLKKALQLFEVEMVKTDGLPPLKMVEFQLRLIFHELICACGHAGYTLKAFELFKKMRDYGFNIHESVYTSLINSCAECPDKKYALEKLNYLREYIAIKGIQPNRYIYNAMIKAYGKNGDIIQSFALVDEMHLKHKIQPGYDTFVQLLIACTQNTDNGLALALKVWRRLLCLCSSPPGLIHFNALLRCLRDCNLSGPLPPSPNSKLGMVDLGRRVDLDSFKNALSLATKHNLLPLDEKSFVQNEVQSLTKLLPGQVSDVAFIENETELETLALSEVGIPDMGSLETQKGDYSILDGSMFPPEMGNLHFESFLDHVAPHLRQPWQKLAVLGGLNGFLRTMAKYNVAPDYKTYTLLAEILPADPAFLDFFLNIQNTVVASHKSNPKIPMEFRIGTKHLNAKYRETMLGQHSSPDSVFYKVLAKRYCMVGDADSARRVFKFMSSLGLKLDLTHFGVLALACRKLPQARQLLADMKELNFRPNIIIMTSLMKTACITVNVPYMVMCLKVMKEHSLQPNPRFLEVMEKTMKRIDKALLNQEYNNKKGRTQDLTPHDSYFKLVLERSGELLHTFRQDYETWLRQVKVETLPHPWQAFAPTEKDIELARNVVSN